MTPLSYDHPRSIPRVRTLGHADCITMTGNSPQLEHALFNKHLLRNTPLLQMLGSMAPQETEVKASLGGGHNWEGKTLIIHEPGCSFSYWDQRLYQWKQCVRICISKAEAVACLHSNRRQCDLMEWVLRSESRPTHVQCQHKNVLLWSKPQILFLGWVKPETEFLSRFPPGAAW